MVQQQVDWGATVYWHTAGRTVSEWAKDREIEHIIARFGQWVVTPYGLECLTITYPIHAQALWDVEGQETVEHHLFAKRWVNREDFHDALMAAREYHRQWPGTTHILPLSKTTREEGR